jgi:hypothetical protein
MNELVEFCQKHRRRIGIDSLGIAYLAIARRAQGLATRAKALSANDKNKETARLKRLLFGFFSQYIVQNAITDEERGHSVARSYNNMHDDGQGNPGIFARVQADDAGPADQAHRREQIESLRQLMSGLPELSREFIWRICDGDSVDYIRKDIGVGTNTVIRNLYKGLWQLGDAAGVCTDPHHTALRHYSSAPPGLSLKKLVPNGRRLLTTKKASVVIEQARHGCTVLYSVEEDAQVDAVAIEAAATNTAHVEITIHRPSGPPTVEKIARGKRRTVFMESVYKIEACSKKPGQRVKIEPSTQQDTSNN